MLRYRVMKTLWDGFCDLLYPPLCILCRMHLPRTGNRSILCTRCESTIELNKPPFCQKCSHPILDHPETSFCRRCKKSTFAFDEAWGVCLYNEAMRRLLHLFKYGQKTSLRHPFTQLFHIFVRTHHLDLTRYEMIVPVPLHPTRMRERGYNQSQLLAEMVSVNYHIPLCLNNLARRRPTAYQAALGRKERWTNIQGAFKINTPVEFFGKSVLIIDDLMTTGATLSEVSTLLKMAGVKRIGALTLAIANEEYLE